MSNEVRQLIAFDYAALHAMEEFLPRLDGFIEGAQWTVEWTLAFIAFGEWAKQWEYDEDDCTVGDLSMVMSDEECLALIMNRPQAFDLWEIREPVGYHMGELRGRVVGAAIVAWGTELQKRCLQSYGNDNPDHDTEECDCLYCIGFRDGWESGC